LAEQYNCAPIRTATKTGYGLENFLQYNAYGPNGRLLEQQRSNDVKEVYLWGYSNTYPVAKILGINSETVFQYISQSQIDAAVSDDGSLRNLFSSLRSNLPNAIIESYTYKPLVGITSKTDAAGRTTFLNMMVSIG